MLSIEVILTAAMFTTTVSLFVDPMVYFCPCRDDVLHH
jgi:hypothetical protein